MSRGRHRRRRQPTGRGPGAAKAFKARQLGLDRVGVEKATLDAMNAECKHLYGLGIGVVLQELDRAEQVLASLREERARAWPVKRWLMTGQVRRARRNAAVWSARYRTVAENVARKAPEEVVRRAAGR